MNNIFQTIVIIFLSLSSSYYTPKIYNLFFENKNRDHDEKLYLKSRLMNIPVLNNGKLDGFIVVQISYRIKTSSQSSFLQAIIEDQIFRLIFSNQRFSNKNISTIDIDTFKSMFIKNTNDKLEAQVIDDVLIQEFNYITRQQMESQ